DVRRRRPRSSPGRRKIPSPPPPPATPAKARGGSVGRLLAIPFFGPTLQPPLPRKPGPRRPLWRTLPLIAQQLLRHPTCIPDRIEAPQQCSHRGPDNRDWGGIAPPGSRPMKLRSRLRSSSFRCIAVSNGVSLCMSLSPLPCARRIGDRREPNVVGSVKTAQV